MKPNNKHTVILLLILTLLCFCCTKESMQINDKEPVYIQVEAVSASGEITYSYIVLVK